MDAGQLYQAVSLRGLSPRLELCSAGMAQSRLTAQQVGVYNQTNPAVEIDCEWLVSGSQVITIPDVDWGMTCSFEYQPTFYFMVAAPLLHGENYTVQAYTDMVSYRPPVSASTLDIQVFRDLGRWSFDFEPDSSQRLSSTA